MHSTIVGRGGEVSFAAAVNQLHHLHHHHRCYHRHHLHLIVRIFLHKCNSMLRDVCQKKKRGNVGIFPKSGTPSPFPPVFFFKIPTSSRFFSANVPKTYKVCFCTFLFRWFSWSSTRIVIWGERRREQKKDGKRSPRRLKGLDVWLARLFCMKENCL